MKGRRTPLAFVAGGVALFAASAVAFGAITFAESTRIGGGLGFVDAALDGVGIDAARLAGGDAPTSEAAATDGAAPTTEAAPSTFAPITAPPTTAAPAAEPATATVSPAIVPVAAPDRPFVAVGNGGGDETARIQQRLLDLGFWLSAPNGSYGLTTSQAVMAFQKYAGLDATGGVNQATADALTNATRRAHGLAEAGTVIEVDKDRQLVFFVQNGAVVWVFNTSTGTGVPYERPNSNDPDVIESGDSVTPNGLHAINRHRPEGWWEGDLGRIYRPKYFVGGVAIHGSSSVPNHPASHGCVRVTTEAMDFIWDADLAPMATPVWVHGSS